MLSAFYQKSLFPVPTLQKTLKKLEHAETNFLQKLTWWESLFLATDYAVVPTATKWGLWGLWVSQPLSLSPASWKHKKCCRFEFQVFPVITWQMVELLKSKYGKIKIEGETDQNWAG